MSNSELKAFYDRLCFALTAYEAVSEHEEACDTEYDRGFALYADVVNIVNDMGEKMF